MDSEDPLGLELARAQEMGQVFAVVDAAHFEYLQDTLTAGRFTFDPLYLDEVDNPSIASGPHLVHVTGPSQIAQLREIIGDEPACVWWVWPDVPDAGKAIYRHLRGLNMVEIPRDRFDQNNETDRGPGYESVLFRHGDPNVLMAMLPVLYAAQVTRLYGQAKSIIVDAPNYHGVRSFDVPDVLPSAQRGQLRISTTEQYDALTKGRLDNSQERIADFVRKHLPPQKEAMTDYDIRTLVAKSDEEGRKLGIRTERGHARWAYLMMMTNGQIAGLEQATDAIRSSANPDLSVKQIIDSTVNALRSGDVQGLED